MANIEIEGLNPSTYTDTRARRALLPTRVVKTWGQVENQQALLLDAPAQPYLGKFRGATLVNTPGRAHAAILLDFGAELNGRLRLTFHMVNGGVYTGRARVRLGESAMEALTPLGEKNATNDHALRDTETDFSALSRLDSAETGFRFAYIELVSNGSAQLASVRAESVMRNLECLGAFECDDKEINRIWTTAARTAHLCMQDYLWDGIKRDRLVWMGDMHTEIMTALALFGAQDVITKSMEFVKMATPPGGWMNGMPSYSLWWLLCVRDLTMETGDIAYMRAQADYAAKLSARLRELIDARGEETLPEKFLDWPNSANKQAQHAGMQALMALALTAAADIARFAGDNEGAQANAQAACRLRSVAPDCGGSKQAAALMIHAGIGDAEALNRDVIVPGGARGYSTFMGLYTLSAKAQVGDEKRALDDMKAYWGGMLKLGATSFWEDFSLDWMENAGRVDEIIEEGKRDPHGDYGAYCYKQFRHSLCHGWASGPVPYLMHHVLGIRPLAPGYTRAQVAPKLASLQFARGAYPTPHGVMKVECEKCADGSVRTKIDAPKGIEIIG